MYLDRKRVGLLSIYEHKHILKHPQKIIYKDNKVLAQTIFVIKTVEDALPQFQCFFVKCNILAFQIFIFIISIHI